MLLYYCTRGGRGLQLMLPVVELMLWQAGGRWRQARSCAAQQCGAVEQVPAAVRLGSPWAYQQAMLLAAGLAELSCAAPARGPALHLIGCVCA
jgi:hypothetical protein